MTKALDRLLDLLDLEQVEMDIFRGRSPDERRQRVFGGQVAGQALVAAGRADRWLLYVQDSPVAFGARGQAHGEVYTAEGELVVSVMQEGLIRASPRSPAG